MVNLSKVISIQSDVVENLDKHKVLLLPGLAGMSMCGDKVGGRGQNFRKGCDYGYDLNVISDISITYRPGCCHNVW